MWTRIVIGVAVSATCLATAWAAEDVPAAPTHEASRYGATRSSSVITAEEIERHQWPTVLDALRGVPGVFVRRSGALGRLTSVVVRGSTDQQVLVLLDGVDVSSPTLGSYDFATLPARFVERIEIIRGSATTVYGARAIGGVISIITTRGDGPSRVRVRSEFGSRRTFEESVSVEGRSGPAHGQVGVNRLDSDGMGAPSGVAATHAAAAGSLVLAKWLALDGAVNSNHSRVGIGDGAFRTDPNRFSQRQQVTASTAFHLTPEGPSDHELRLTYNLDDLMDLDGPDPGTLERQSKSVIDTERYGLELRNRLDAGAFGRLTTGAEVHEERATTTRFTKGNPGVSWYAQHEVAPMDRLVLIGGVRDTRLHFYGQTWTADASAAYRIPVIETTLRGAFSQGLRPPTMNELFFPNFGNRDLSPEKSRMFELAAGRDWWDARVGVDVAVFRTSVRNLIQTMAVGNGRFQAGNISQAVMTGLELTGHVEPLTGLRLKGAWTGLNTKDLSTGDELARVPQSVVSLSAEYAGASWWDVHLEGLLAGSQEEPVAGNNRQRVKPYSRVDGGASIRLSRLVRLRGRIENLFNRRYSEVLGFPAAGTRFYIGASVDL